MPYWQVFLINVIERLFSYATIQFKYIQGIKMLLASGCECFIEVGVDMEEACWM